MREIVNKGYELFAQYRVNRPLDVCTDCCMTIEDESKLASLPVKEIPLELLSTYNDSAKPEKTRIEEVKHFLPRYLDLIANYNFPTHSTELALSRIVPFDKSEWTKNELEFLETFAATFFQHTLKTYPIPSFYDRIDALLIMLWKAGFNIERLLKIWEETDTLQSVLHYNDLHYHGFKEHNKNELSSGFGDKALWQVLTHWLQQDKTKKIFKLRIEQVILGEYAIEENILNELNLLYESL